MRKLEKAQKIGITCAILCCALLTLVFSADYKKLFASVTDALNALTGTEATATVDSMVVMNTEDAQQTDDYYAFGVYAPSAATYTIGVTAENGKMRINTGEAIAVDGTEVSVSLTEGTNVLYFVDCENPSIQWDSENCDLEPVNKVCMPLSGDVDQSENRTVEDLVLIKKEAAVTGSGNIERTEIADIDGNDSVTNEDAGLLRTLMVGNPEYEVAERSALIVDAYIEETGTLYDTLAEAVEAASEKSVSDSKSVTVTVLNPKDVKLTAQIPVQGGAQIILQDDGSKDNGWSRTITRGSEEAFKMFTVADATLTLTGSSGSDEHSSLILDGGAIANAKNHIVDVGWTPSTAESGTLTMNAGVKLTNNINSGSNSGGGALAIKYTFNMNGGIISGNINAGNSGAINLGTSGTMMNMTGGIITENETRTDIHSAGGVNISNGATLIMTGGEIYGNIAPDSVGGNSVRKSSETSTLQMGGSAYIDRVCFDSTSVNTHCMELTSKLTTDKEISLFFTQPLNEANAVIKRDSSCSENDALFTLSERMLPCKLEQDATNTNLCLRSDITNMDKVTAVQKVYSSGNISGQIDNEWVVQGVCSDGQYLYMAITKNDSSGCRILKVNLATWSDVELGATILTDHSNEMTYNPTTKKIYITHCISTELGNTTEEQGPYTISVVDPSDINTVEDTIELPVAETYTGKKGIYALAYNATQQYYVAGGTGFRFGFLKDDNGTITECAMSNTGLSGFTGYTAYTKQGIYGTDTTIYANTWYDIINVEDEEMNFITMYDWSGNYNGSKCVVQADETTPFSQEIESMFEYDNKMYMACIPTDHTGVEIYELGSVGEAASTIDVKDSTGTVVDGVYTNLADAVAKANELGTATIVLKDDVTIGATQEITGKVTIIDDGTKRTIQRGTGCTNEMFNVAGGATLTFTSTTTDESNPMLVIDGNKEDIEVKTGTYAPVVKMNQTNGILNITPGVIVQNNKSGNTGGVIYAGANKGDTTGGGLATINITGGLFKDNEIEYSSGQHLFGGCIYIESGCTLNISNATFDNTTMVQNYSSGTKTGMTYGGVISVRTNKNHSTTTYGPANVKLENCTFENTSVTQTGSTYGGGVLYIGDGQKNDVKITNCKFTGNETQGLGGAIYMANTKTAFELSSCNFSNNNDVTGSNDIYMAASTKVDVSGTTKANINCVETEQIHITEALGTESVIKVSVSNAVAGATVATFASEDIMTACKENRNIVLSEASYALSYDATNLNATLVDAVAVVEDSGYASLAEAIDVASTMTSDVENPVVIKLISDTVAINSVTTIPTGAFVEIIDDGTQRTLQRADGCTNEMFNVAGGAGLTFTSSTKDDSNPMLVIDGNKVNVETAGYAPVVDMNQTNGILNITSGVIVQNNKSKNTGGVIFAGLNGTTNKSGSEATINITGGLFTGNEVEYSASKYLFGGCIYIESGCTLNISNATFESTTVAQNCTGGMTYGGVISVRTNASHLYDGANVTLENCTFKNTSVTQKGSGNGGGVLYIGAGNPNGVQIANCEFIGNATGGLGGAIYMSNTTTAFKLSGCSFSNNTDVNGTNDIYMVASTKVNVSGNTQANIKCAGTEQIHITETLGTESVINVTMSSAATGATVATFASEEIMSDCRTNGYVVLTNREYILSYETASDSEYIATLVDAVAEVGGSGYTSLAEAIDVASTMESDAENPVVITLIGDTVAINSVTTIPTGTFVEIIDDGTQRTLQRADGCTNEMFNVAGGAGLTFTSSTKDDNNPMLVIDGNKENVETSGYAPVVDMNQTDGILNITQGVIVQNNKSHHTGGIIFAGKNSKNSDGGGQATINITGGLFTGNEVEYSGGYLFGGCIYIESGCTLTIRDASFENITVTQSYASGKTYGGVLCVRTSASHPYDGANVTLEDCIFKNTTVTQKGSASGNGGGVLYIGDGNPSSVQITNCEFTNNATEGLGGALYMSNTEKALELSGCRFSNNTDANGTNDIYMVASTNVNVSGNTQANIKCAGTEQIHITETLGTESVINVTMSSAATGATVATFASEEIMSDCRTNGYVVLTNSAYTMIYETTSESKYIAKLGTTE